MKGLLGALGGFSAAGCEPDGSTRGTWPPETSRPGIQVHHCRNSVHTRAYSRGLLWARMRRKVSRAPSDVTVLDASCRGVVLDVQVGAEVNPVQEPCTRPALEPLIQPRPRRELEALVPAHTRDTREALTRTPPRVSLETLIHAYTRAILGPTCEY